MRWEIIDRATSYTAEEMGVSLKRSALSPNIRERMDHSCAVVDIDGQIIAQAEHIPVHLGSFSVGVRNVLNWLLMEKVELQSNDTLISNEPYLCGTHLNDVMILSPVEWHGKIVCYVVNKAHHTDIGGRAPGSINPDAKLLYDEGIVIPPIHLIKLGVLRKDILEFLAHNVKTPDITLGDLQAQFGCNKTGVARLRELFDKYGPDTVFASWKEAILHSERITKGEISNWKIDFCAAEDYLENDTSLVPIRVRIKSESSGGISADFEGSSPQIESPLNSVFGVCFASVAFAIRCLMGRDLPTNEGFYRSINVRAPIASIVNAQKPAPVAAGNLETSQRIVDVVFKALADPLESRVPAAASGTMMNLMMGGLTGQSMWAYYETIGGGTGGHFSGPGVSGVQVNMTNTRNTPIEVAERIYPIIFTTYGLREGSGGKGLHNGGDGIIRGITASDRIQLSIISDRFLVKPWGLKGGNDGMTGKVRIMRYSEKQPNDCPSKFTTQLFSGDTVLIETPGGGGWGVAN